MIVVAKLDSCRRKKLSLRVGGPPVEDEPGEGIYRAMIEDRDGMPLLGLTALKLGVRKGVDILADQRDMVYRPAFRPGEPNGLSCENLRTIQATRVKWARVTRT